MDSAITTVVFDLDDTLYDEAEYCKSGFKAAAECLTRIHPACGTTESVYDVFWQMFQKDRTRTFDAALPALNLPIDKELIRTLIRRYRCHTPVLTLPADSRLVLQQLSGEYILALLTDGYLPAQRLKVRALDIQRYFKHIVYTEQIGRAFWKPSPAGFEAILAALQQPPQSMVYIGDNPVKDFIAPNRLGMKTIQIKRPRRLHLHEAATPEAQARHVITSFSELISILTDGHTAGKVAGGTVLPCQ